MKIKVLVDNNTFIDEYYCGEPAVSLYIEDEDVRILFDVGYSDLFLRNMEQFKINIEDIDVVVISHGHNDHTGGLKYLFTNGANKTFKLVGHSNAFEYKSDESGIISSPFNAEQLKKMCKLELTSKPMKVSNNITFLGEIPQTVEHEVRKAIGNTYIDGELVDDSVVDDSALVFKGRTGIYIITGCSHSGICNIIEYAKKVTHCDNVLGIIGGFHLFCIDEGLNKTIDFLKDHNIGELYPCHCTSFKVKSEINNEMDVQEVGVGLTLDWI